MGQNGRCIGVRRKRRTLEIENVIDNCRGFQSIPVIDVQNLRSPGSTLDERRRVGFELDRACRDVGFFYVRNHGVCDDLTIRVRELSRRWFDLPAGVKAQIALTANCKQKGFRGYQALGSNVTRYDGGFQRDWHEAIDLYKHFDESHPAAKAGLPLHGPNPWPTQVEGYREALETYVQECISLGADLLRGIALGLHLDEDFFGGSNAGDPFWVMRIIHYPPLELAPSSSGSESTFAASQGEEVDRSVQLSCE
jgi:isopenicillin N synthase-like dioxygenase